MNYPSPLQIRKTGASRRVPLSPLPQGFSPIVKLKSIDMEKENMYPTTPNTSSTFESPHSDMDSPYFTLR